MENKKLICKKCGSTNVKVDMVSNVISKRKGKSIGWRIFYWLCFGWLIDLFIWFFAFIPRLFYRLFKPRKQHDIKTKVDRYQVCNNCGHSEMIK